MVGNGEIHLEMCLDNGGVFLPVFGGVHLLLEVSLVECLVILGGMTRQHQKRYQEDLKPVPQIKMLSKRTIPDGGICGLMGRSLMGEFLDDEKCCDYDKRNPFGYSRGLNYDG